MGVFRKVYTSPIPPGAVPCEIRCKIRGVSTTVAGVRFTGRDGRVLTARLSKSGKTILRASPYWYGLVNGKPRRLCRDKLASETMLADLIRNQERSAVGLTDPHAANKAVLLSGVLERYTRYLRHRNLAASSVQRAITHLRRIFTAMHATTLGDLNAQAAEAALATLRQPPVAPCLPAGKQEFTIKDVSCILGSAESSVSLMLRRRGFFAQGQGRRSFFPRQAVERLLQDRYRGMSEETYNQYRGTLIQFANWLCRHAKLLPSNPFLDLPRLRVGVNRHLWRRELTQEELQVLLTLTKTGPTRLGLSGHTRFVLYALACTTGLRASSLASLTLESFDLDGNPPLVVVAARNQKNRKPHRLPLTREIVALLRDYLPQIAPGQPLFPGPWAKNRRGGYLLQLDLHAAGIPYRVLGPNGWEQADFHSLRHTYLSVAGRNGVDVFTLKELAGHADTRTTERYCHRRLEDLAKAQNKLPPLLL